jgi:hypothetical protein
VWLFAKEECKRSTISLKKDGLVYDLTEIDGRRSDREIHVPPPPEFTAGNTIESTKIVLTTSYGTIRPCP